MGAQKNQIDREDVRSFVTSPRYRPLTFSELSSEFRVRAGDRKRLKRILFDLERTGDVVKLRNNRYAPAAPIKQVTGKLQYNRRGFGFVVPEDGSDDLFIAGENLGGALHGDKVTVEVNPKKNDRRTEGRVREVLERGIDTVVGQVKWTRTGSASLAVFGESIPYPVQLVTPLPESYSRDTDPVVAVRIDWDNSTADQISGSVIEVLGPLSDPSIDSKMVIYRSDLPRKFPEDVLEEVKRIPEAILPEEIARRKDLRALPFVTIDGADARDHDDAIVLEKPGVVWVAIADVSHYVATGRAIDVEAASRGNSFYFPDQVIPMLPERLSNDLCSLRPKVDRLCLAARLEISSDGSLQNTELFEVIIHSKARLTYEGVDRALKNGADADTPAELLPMLKDLLTLGERTFAKRMSEGGIDFDLSETKVILDKHGIVTAMSRRERTPAQRIVEECMLAANKGVARVLSEADYPAVYRIHEKPDQKKLMDFLYILNSYGYTAKLDVAKGDPHEIDRLLHRFDNDPRGKVFSYLALRSMRQASYSPQNSGHYGLGFKDYLHFTSPIRRYADLIVHRSARGYIRKEKPRELFPKVYGSMETISTYISSQERVAQLAEREIRLLKGIRFFQDKIGKTFVGFVTGMVSQGLFVELEEHAVEGFIHVSKLTGDNYDYFEREKIFRGRRNGKTVRLGDRLTVKVDEASLQDFKLNFSIAASPAGARPAPRKR